MDIRVARPEDATSIRDLARRSLSASYSHALDEDAIEAAVDEWYDAENVRRALDDDDTLFLLAVDGDEPVGFSQSVVVARQVPTGEIHWLHVDPDRRDEGVGSRLLRRTEELLDDRGATRLAGRVLEVNEAGGDFYEAHDYEHAGKRTVDVDGEQYAELEYGRSLEADGEVRSPVEVRTAPDGSDVWVAYDDLLRGSKAPLYAVFDGEDRERRLGWICGNCESFDIAMDTMGRMECNDCGNRRKPLRWDAAYL